MLTEERRQQILARVNASPEGAIQVSELAEALGVSGMTIRRDLEELEHKGLLKRVHGGAISCLEGLGLTWIPFAARRREYSQEKQQIGWLAAQLVQDGEKIILDSGTTTLQIARRLAEKRELCLVTNSLPISEVAARFPHARVILLGGELRTDELCSVGSVAAQQVAQYSVDKAFIGASGFSIERGATDSLLPEVEVKQAMMRAARQAILVVDSSKWNIERFIRIAELGAFHTVITDDHLPPEGLRALQMHQVEVLMPQGNFTLPREE